MLGVKKDDKTVVALIPSGASGYGYFDVKSGKRVKITKQNEQLFDEEALAFYKPLPLKKIDIKELLKYMAQTLAVSDFVMIAIATFAAALIGMLLPKLNNILFSDIIASGSVRLLVAVAVFIVCASVSTLIINSIKALITSRITTKMNISVQAATMMRILSLLADFFKDYGAGELSNRTQYMNALCTMIVSAVLTTGLTSVFSLVYITQIFVYAPALAGAEKRAFARWGALYAEQAACTYNPPMFIKINTVISTAISLTGTIVMYYAAVSSKVSVADYYAFNTAYGMMMGAFMSLAGIALTIAQLKPIFEMVKPLLDTVPEIAQNKQVITRLSGGVELDNVSFRYTDNMPLVLDGLSLKIRAGQYVAIVGKTGCGKSTLMRLLLGFERPQKGAVYYDGKNLDSIDLKSLRQNIGVVMQNSKLFFRAISTQISRYQRRANAL